MSYKTFEINNGVLTVKDAMYKGIAACKNNTVKEIPKDEDVDIYLDSDNWSIDSTELYGCDPEEFMDYGD